MPSTKPRDGFAASNGDFRSAAGFINAGGPKPTIDTNLIKRARLV